MAYATNDCLRKTYVNDLPKSGHAVRENGIDYDKVNYFNEAFTADRLKNPLEENGHQAVVARSIDKALAVIKEN